MVWIFWLGSAILAGILAAHKKRSILVHSFLTLVCPVWLLFPLLLFSFKDCPHCNRRIKEDIKICICGFEFK